MYNGVSDKFSRRLKAFLPIFFLFIFMTPVFPQERVAQPAPPEYKQGSENPIGPGDVLLINVNNLKEFSRRYYVSNSGKIHIPNLGIIPVNDLTPTKLQAEITRRLREKDLLKDPIWVSVGIAESRSHSVYLLGEVMQPGQFALTNDYHITDLIFQGVGFNEVRSRYGYLYRRSCDAARQKAEGPEECTLQQALKIDFKELLEGTDPTLNLQLQGGDILHVPERQPAFFYVVGDVVHPGSIDIPFDTKVVVTQAIAWSGGPTKTAKLSKGVLLRYDEKGTRQEFRIDFQAILKGKQPDFPVLPNDLIFIPGSRVKTLGYGLLNVVPGIASSPVY